VVAIQLSLLLALTGVIVWAGESAMVSLRHLYLLPTLWAAFASGTSGGCLAGLVAGFLQAPLVLPGIERTGLDPGALDRLVTLATPLASGWVVGRLRDQSRARAVRLGALLEIQRELAREEPLYRRLEDVAERTRTALGALRVGLVLGTGDSPAVASAPVGAGLDNRSAAAWTLRGGGAVTSRDLASDPRFQLEEPPGPAPRPALVLPLESGAGAVGALALEWRGDLTAATRVAAHEIAMHLALGIENARLTLRQRRFAVELEDKVAAATRRLLELDRAKSEFLSVVSHEIRTPLTALQGFSELLLSRTVPPEQARRFIGHIHSEAERLGRIVTELLDLSRIEAGRPEALRREPVDMGDMVERNLEIFAQSNPRHRFRWRPGENLPPIVADRDALDRMLTNLLSNAVKYAPRGGDVTVSAGPAPGPDRMMEISVEDQGVGIPAEALPRIFDKYVRVPDPETIGARGLGLGLAVVKALAEAHGGWVEVESRAGVGSRFRVLMPL